MLRYTIIFEEGDPMAQLSVKSKRGDALMETQT